MSTALPMTQISVGNVLLPLDECVAENTNKFTAKFNVDLPSSSKYEEQIKAENNSEDKTFTINLTKTENNLSTAECLAINLEHTSNLDNLNEIIKDNENLDLRIKEEESFNNLNNKNRTNITDESISSIFKRLPTNEINEITSKSIDEISAVDLLATSKATSTIVSSPTILRKSSVNGTDNNFFNENAQRTQDLIKKQINEIEKEINRRIQNKNVKKVIMLFLICSKFTKNVFYLY